MGCRCTPCRRRARPPHWRRAGTLRRSTYPRSSVSSLKCEPQRSHRGAADTWQSTPGRTLPPRRRTPSACPGVSGSKEEPRGEPKSSYRDLMVCVQHRAGRDIHGDDAHERPEQGGGAPRGQLRAQLAEHLEEDLVGRGVGARTHRHTRARLGLGAAGRGRKCPDAAVLLPQPVRVRQPLAPRGDLRGGGASV